MSKIIWKPQPKQFEFMSRSEFEVFYGGAAGGGKSDALVIEALRQVQIPHYRAALFRKTIPDAANLIDKTMEYYTQLPKKTRPQYKAQSHVWVFPSGAQIKIASLPHEQDKYKYQGSNFDMIGFDELTQFTFSQYMYLRSRCRPSGPGTDCYIRCTGNPGGIGHQWVKERFITAGTPMKTIWENVEWQLPEGGIGHQMLSRCFVPSNIFDNAALMANDPSYIASLASLPAAERDALLYGDWDSFNGQVFAEWRNDSEHYKDQRWTHVIDPFRIPDHWKIYQGMDWGYAKPFAVIWLACSPEGRLYQIQEYYGCTGEPDVGVKMEPAEVAQKIREIEADDPNLKGKFIIRIGDPAIWGTQTGQSVGTLMEKERIYFDKGKNDRLSGKMQVHHRLRFDEEGLPMLQIFSTCRNMIRTLPTLVYDEKVPEDVDTTCEDHLYDALKYVLQENTYTPPLQQIKKPKPYDPLSTPFENRPDRYEFYRKY